MYELFLKLIVTFFALSFLTLTVAVRLRRLGIKKYYYVWWAGLVLAGLAVLAAFVLIFLA